MFLDLLLDSFSGIYLMRLSQWFFLDADCLRQLDFLCPVQLVSTLPRFCPAAQYSWCRCGCTRSRSGGNSVGSFEWELISGKRATFNGMAASDDLAVAVGAAGSLATSEDLSFLDYRPRITDQNLNGIVWGNDLFVAVGQDNAIFTSVDGLNWVDRTPDFETFSNHRLFGIIWTGTRFVAFGNYGTILTSEDGVTWSKRETGDQNAWYKSAVWTGTQVVVVGENVVVVSSDGVEWSTVTLVGEVSAADTAWNGSIFVSIDGPGGIYTSSDAATWTKQFIATTRWFSGVVWMGEKFVAVGGNGTAATSVDGVNWDLHQTENTSSGFVEHHALALIGDTLVTVGLNDLIMLSTDGEDWFRAGADFDQTLFSVIWTGSRLVASGAFGTILSSSDGALWERSSTNIQNNLNSVVWTGTHYVAVGNGGIILTSPDLANWTVQESGTDELLIGVAWGNQRAIVTGNNGTLLSSQNLTDWTALESPTSSRIEMIHWNGTLFAAITPAGELLISADGVTWITEIVPTIFGGFLAGVKSTPDSILVVGEFGELKIREEGGQWFIPTTGTFDDLFSVVANETTTVIVGESGIVLSGPNEGNPTERASGTDVDLFDVVWTGERFVAVGRRGGVTVSEDGETWVSRGWSSSRQKPSIIYADGKYVAAGDDPSIATSPDGVFWTAFETDVNGWDALRSVAWSGDTYVAVGVWRGGETRSRIYSSSDAENWTLRLEENSLFGLSAVCWTGSLFVVGGTDGKIFTSPDGIDWTERVLGITDFINEVAAGNGQIIAVGSSGGIAVSADGVSWSPASSEIPTPLFDIVWADSRWIAVGIDTLSSPDGVNWTIGSNNGPRRHSILWTGNRYISFGENGRIEYSETGSEWINANGLISNSRFDEAVYVNGKIVAVGTSGGIAIGDEIQFLAPRLALNPVSAEQFEISFATEVGCSYLVIQYDDSQAPPVWQDVGEFTPGDGSISTVALPIGSENNLFQVVVRRDN